MLVIPYDQTKSKSQSWRSAYFYWTMSRIVISQSSAHI